MSYAMPAELRRLKRLYLLGKEERGYCLRIECELRCAEGFRHCAKHHGQAERRKKQKKHKPTETQKAEYRLVRLEKNRQRYIERQRIRNTILGQL